MNQENMNQNNNIPDFTQLLNNRPVAKAMVRGSSTYPNIRGDVWFYQTTNGVLVISDIEGLPKGSQCSSPIFAFHIHEGDSCTGNNQDPFANAGTHYNPHRCPHPYHAGDLPPLFSANGFAFSSILTDRFTLDEIIGRTIIIHSSVDDLKTQPAGNSGAKIACGVIQRIG